MEKRILPLILATALCGITGSATAASGDAQFLGVVTSGTCDIHVEVNGVRTNIVSFGTVPASGSATTDVVFVPFSLVPDNGSAACTGLTNAVTVNWSPGVFSPAFFSDQPDTLWPAVHSAGKASEAFVILMADGTQNSLVGLQGFVQKWTATQLLSSSVKYQAGFAPGTVPGDFHAAVAWVVSYE